MNFESLDWTPGTANIPGLRPIGYYGFTEEAETIPELPSNPASMSNAGVITSNIVMKAGKTMLPMYGTLTKLNLKGEAQGERDAMTKTRTITWKYPDTNAAAIGFDIATTNANMFFVVTDHNGRMRLVGNKSIPAVCKASDDSGTASSDDKGYTYEITDFGIGAAPIYQGDLPVDSSLMSEGIGV
jgi:hypothetical protein